MEPPNYKQLDGVLLGLKKKGAWAQRQFDYGQWCKNMDISRWLRSFTSPWTRTCRFSFRQTPIFPRLFPMWRSQKWHVAITKKHVAFPLSFDPSMSWPTSTKERVVTVEKRVPFVKEVVRTVPVDRITTESLYGTLPLKFMVGYSLSYTGICISIRCIC